MHVHPQFVCITGIVLVVHFSLKYICNGGCFQTSAAGSCRVPFLISGNVIPLVPMYSHVYHAKINATVCVPYWTAFLRMAVFLHFHSESECLYCKAVSFFTCPVDVIKALQHEVDAKWREFGTHLQVKPALMDSIRKDESNTGARDCMLQLVEKWLGHEDGTGSLPRTWTTVAQAVKDTGNGRLAEQLVEQYGVQLS